MLWSIISVIIVSLISFVGVLGLALSDKVLKKVLIFLVAFSAGGLMGGAFFHLLPESSESINSSIELYVYVLVGFSLFFMLERILRWHHCHDVDCQTHQHLGWMNLVGDGVHNLIDGMVIYAAFSVGPELGIPVVISIIFHEIPQELGDFGVLVYSGFSKLKALLYNFASGLFAVLGVFLAYFLFSFGQCGSCFLLPIAAGGFIYIAASDLIPEIHKQEKNSVAVLSFVIFVVALLLMLGVKLLSE